VNQPKRLQIGIFDAEVGVSVKVGQGELVAATVEADKIPGLLGPNRNPYDTRQIDWPVTQIC
jgi:hypothetical protein